MRQTRNVHFEFPPVFNTKQHDANKHTIKKNIFDRTVKSIIIINFSLRREFTTLAWFLVFLKVNVKQGILKIKS